MVVSLIPAVSSSQFSFFCKKRNLTASLHCFLCVVSQRCFLAGAGKFPRPPFLCLPSSLSQTPHFILSFTPSDPLPFISRFSLSLWIEPFARWLLVFQNSHLTIISKCRDLILVLNSIVIPREALLSILPPLSRITDLQKVNSIFDVSPPLKIWPRLAFSFLLVYFLKAGILFSEYEMIILTMLMHTASSPHPLPLVTV